jgi:hypothetical protein
LQLGLDPSFIQETSDEAGIGRVITANDFDDDRPLCAFNPHGRGEKNFAHAPASEPAEQEVATKKTRKFVAERSDGAIFIGGLGGLAGRTGKRRCGARYAVGVERDGSHAIKVYM